MLKVPARSLVDQGLSTLKLQETLQYSSQQQTAESFIFQPKSVLGVLARPASSSHKLFWLSWAGSASAQIARLGSNILQLSFCGFISQVYSLYCGDAACFPSY